MSRNAAVELLVCYDIRNERRLRRIHRCMRAWGMPLQYSVFYCRLVPQARRRMENRLRQLMDQRTDDIRIYGIQSLAETQFIGSHPMPDAANLYGTDIF